MGCIFHKSDLSDTYEVVDAYIGERNLCGMRHGYGVLTYPTGDRYQGMWKWDKRHGLGDYIYVDGRRITGYWYSNEYMESQGPSNYQKEISEAEAARCREIQQQREAKQIEREQRALRRKQREREIRQKYGLA